MFSDTFAGIAPASAPLFILMQLVGGALGYGLLRLLYPEATLIGAEVAAEHPRARRPRQRPTRATS
jgi:arsenate reductase